MQTPSSGPGTLRDGGNRKDGHYFSLSDLLDTSTADRGDLLDTSAFADEGLLDSRAGLQPSLSKKNTCFSRADRSAEIRERTSELFWDDEVIGVNPAFNRVRSPAQAAINKAPVNRSKLQV